MLDAMWAGLAAMMTLQVLFFTIIGIVYGIVVGILPGLGGIVAMALLLPFTWGREFPVAMSLLLGAHIATIWGSSVTSILFRVPGAAKSVALIFDGFPMTQRGEASRALGASAMAALMGGVVGAVFLALAIPVTRPVMMALGPAEYLMLALWGLTIISAFSEGSLLKGMVAAGLGLLTAFVGMDLVTATPRFTFGSIYLLDGVSFPVAMIGLFAIAEMMKLFVKGRSLVERDVNVETSTVWDGVRDTMRHWGLVVRSSLLGLWIGVLPGIGGSVGGIAAYAQALRTSKHPETFGKGNVEGVIAPDATLGANEGGGLLPTLALGIPGGEGMAIVLIAFVGLGVVPGPAMLTDHLDLVFNLVWIVAIASVITALIGLAIAPYLARVPSLNNSIIIPLVLSICLIGAYADRGQVSDVVVAAFFGVVGFVMDKYRFSRATFVIGMVLALMIERNLHLSISLYGTWFLFERPGALIMLLLILATTAYPFYRNWRRDKELRKIAAAEHGDVAETIAAAPAAASQGFLGRRAQDNLIAVLVIVIFAAAIYASLGYGPRARLVPIPIAAIGIVLMAAQLALQNMRAGQSLEIDLLEVIARKSTGDHPEPQPAGEDAAGEGAAEASGAGMRALAAFGIVLLIVGMFLVIGPLPTMFLFTAGYFALSRFAGLARSILYALVATLAVYALFHLWLGVDMRRGLIDLGFGLW